jgi:DNA-binding response OmpR family regulator
MAIATSDQDPGTLIEDSEVEVNSEPASHTNEVLTMITEKILVVDDEENVCHSIKKVLSRKGYEISQAFTVDDAVKLIKDMTFDLVITDLMIPGTSGLELLQIVRDHYPELDVIMITGYASIESAVKATKLGASAYLPKPFTPDELTKVIESTLANRIVRARTKPSQKIQPQEEELPDENIDVDMPFSIKEMEQATSKEFVDKLTRSDIPQVKRTSSRTEFCNTGQRECRRLVLEGIECVGECPLEKKARERAMAPLEKKRTQTQGVCGARQTHWFDVNGRAVGGGMAGFAVFAQE